MLLIILFISSVFGTTEVYEDTSAMPTAGSERSSCISGNDQTITSDALKKLNVDYLTSCLAQLGKDRLQEQQAVEIWNRLLEVSGGAPEYVPEYLIRHLGWIAIGIPASHMLNLTMTDVDTVAALGVFRNLSESQLSALAQAFTDQWPSKEPEDWTDLDLAMFGHILCGFNETDILRMHADAYKMAALDGRLANLRGCNNESMQALAKLAVSVDAFGEPQLWEPTQVRAVGCVLSGLTLETLALIPAKSMSGLSPESVRCLPTRVTSSLTFDQLSNLSPGASTTIGGVQKDLDVTQARPFNAQQDYTAKNESYPLVNIICGFVAVFWTALLWSVILDELKFFLYR